MAEGVGSPVTPTKTLPYRRVTSQSTTSEDAVPSEDPKNTVELLIERLTAWKHVVDTIEDYMGTTEKIQKAQAKEYERVLKTIQTPIKAGHHFEQNVGGIASLFENMRQNTEALIRTHVETEKNIKDSILPAIERLRKDIRNKCKEISSGLGKGVKDIEKARNTTQKHIELLGQNAAGFDASGSRINSHEDPYVLHRGVIHRLSKQLVEENNQRQALIPLQEKTCQFEQHVLEVIQTSLASLAHIMGVQVRSQQEHYLDMLKTAQEIPANYEWNGFISRFEDKLVDPNAPDRSIENIKFPNQDHRATIPVIEGILERKSRNKLSLSGFSSGYYVVTMSKFLHEFRDSDCIRRDPIPELSIFLPDAIISYSNDNKFSVKGKDVSGGLSSKLSGHSDFQFKASSSVEAQNWLKALQGATNSVNTESKTSSEPKIEEVKEASSPPTYSEASGVAVPGNVTEVTTKPITESASETDIKMAKEKAAETNTELASENLQIQDAHDKNKSITSGENMKVLSSNSHDGKFVEKLD